MPITQNYRATSEIRPDGGSVYYGSGPPTLSTDGAYVAGDIVMAVNATTGVPWGWRCIASGSPGQWEAIGLTQESMLSFGPLGAATNFAVPVDNNYSIQAIYVTYGSGSTSGTLMIERDTGSTFPGSTGTTSFNQLASTISLSSSINTVYTGVIIGSPATFSSGLDRIGFVFAGTMTGQGNLYIDLVLKRVN